MAARIKPGRTGSLKTITQDLNVPKGRASLVSQAAYYFRPTPSKAQTEYVVHGTAPLKLHWDLFLMIFVFYNSVSVPFLAAFDQHSALLVFEVIEFTIDFCFAVDIMLSFRTSYLDHSGDEVVEPGVIARHYGYSYKFPLDLVSVIPIEAILVTCI